MKEKIGLFGGTFDPLHNGHLNLAIEFFEKCGLSEVWFIPTNIPPFRSNGESQAAIHRLKMTQLAIQEIPHFKVVESEMKREGVSYTIDTVKEILEKYEGTRFYLLLGEDAALHLPRWKEASTLIQLIPLLVGSRAKIELQKKVNDPTFPAEIGQAIQKGIVETNLMDIEATILRKRLKEKLYCGHLLPSKVLDYIYENQLYYNA